MKRLLTATTVVVASALLLAGCGGGGGGGSTEQPPMEQPDPAIAERNAISTAIGTATTAVNAVDNDSTNAEVMTADMAIAAATRAIAAAANVPAHEKAANTGTVNALATVLASAKTSRMAAMSEADRKAAEAMAVTAAKLYAGISAPGGTGANTRTAAYGTSDNADNIGVMIGAGEAVNLSEDKTAMVNALHGWEGKKYTAAPDDDGMYEAVVYSNVGEPTMGLKFGSATDDDDYQYTLNAETNTELTITSENDTAVQARIASPSFDQSVGKKEFELPDNTVRVMISGTYHGVSGTYNCTPATDQTCSASVAAEGFTLANGTWTFKASSNETRVMDTPDANYASYGWWLHKSEDGTYTASAFADDKGEVPAASGITALRGTATYSGGAAGKYALTSSTGGTNDAGHFTAAATLEADFGDDMISGIIDNFTGADGQSRDWSVKLNETDIGDTGVIDGLGGADNDVQVGTVWTIGGDAAAKSGQWSGDLQDNGDDDAPKVGSGTFYTEYDGDGRMVGGFGVNKQ